MKSFVPDFFIVPRQLIEDPSIQPLDQIVYAAIYWYHSMKEGTCFAGNPTLAEITNSSVRGVQNALSRLEKGGYINRVMLPKGRELVPLINLVKTHAQNASLFDHSLSSNEDSTILKRSPLLSSNEDKNNNIEKKTIYTEILSVWNDQKVTQHAKLSREAESEIKTKLKTYSLADLTEMITLYGKVYREPKYFWSYKWNLYEFLKRGVPKFEGKTPDDFIKKSSNGAAKNEAPKKY